MFWDDPDDSRNRQRLKNGLFLKVWVSNGTRDEMMPVMGCTMLVILVVAILAMVFSYDAGEKRSGTPARATTVTE